MPDSVTQILSSGPPGEKFNIAVLGDGFAETDQNEYNALVQSLLLDGVFGRDYFYEDRQAYNIFRVNLTSKDSGVSTRTYDEKSTPADGSDDTIASETKRDTALGYIYSGSWAHCWLEGSADTSAKVQAALSKWVPDQNLVVIILNNSGFGGCGGGGFQIVTKGTGWDVLAHEFGHGTGGLADEYCAERTYSGGEPGAVNVTVATDRTALKWKRFVNPTTPIPTAQGKCADWAAGSKPSGWDDAQDVGLFEGGGTNNTGMYRPVVNCRMRANSPEFCPVCYTTLKDLAFEKSKRTFLRCYPGDLNGDGKDDLLIHTGNSITTYRSDGSKLDLAFNAVGSVPGSWQFAENDQFFVADFNGDGKAEVIVFNGTDWDKPYLGLLAYDGKKDGKDGLQLIARYDGSLPNWQMNRNDQFFVANFDGDGKADLFVFNGSDWSMPYFALLRSTGTGLSVVQRYDRNLPGWQMAKNDRYFAGDFNGDGKADLFVFNGTDWGVRYFAMLRSTGNALQFVRRFDNTLAGWQMARNDRHYIGDFDGDGKADVYVFNGTDWNPAYLAMLRSDGSNLSMVRRYDGNIPGWQMRKNDRHWIGDVNGDRRADLFVYNCDDWSKEYLGTLTSNGSALSGSWAVDWVGEWNLGKVDSFEPCNFEGVPGKRNLIVHNKEWLGLMRAASAPQLQRIYYRYIHNYRYGRNW